MSVLSETARPRTICQVSDASGAIPGARYGHTNLINWVPAA